MPATRSIATVALFILTISACASNDSATGRGPAITATASKVVLARGHAHNDYSHQRPLQDALSNGFASVEVDVHLRNGQLFVAHDADDISSDRTLSRLYLEPLRSHVSVHDGSVFPDGSRLTLLIDIKTEPEETYRALSAVLRRFEDILTVYSDGDVKPGAVTVIISGNRARETMESESVRYAAYDGRLDDLEAATPSAFMPLISDNWTRHFTWAGRGAMPSAERLRLQAIVETAHRNGRRVRFWATPDQPGAQRDAVWQALIDADVDLINTDDLEGLREFLTEHDPDLVASRDGWLSIGSWPRSGP